MSWGNSSRPVIDYGRINSPSPREGVDGDIQIRQSKLGARLFGKIGGKWYHSPLTATDGNPVTRFGTGLSNYLSIDNNSVDIFKNKVKVAEFGEEVIIGEVGASKSNVQITSGVINLRNNTTNKITLDASGNIKLSGKMIVGKADGTFNNSDNISIGQSNSNAGLYNVSIGFEAGKVLEGGGGGGTSLTNVLIGYKAGEAIGPQSSNTCIGEQAGGTSSSNSTMIGGQTSPSGSGTSNEICLGFGATGKGSNTAVIGNSSVTDVYMNEDGEAILHAGEVKVAHATAPQMSLHRADSTIVTNESIGEILFTAADPSGTNTGCKIKAQAKDGWSSNDYPSELQFYTAPSAGTTTQRMVINKDGNVGIGTDDPGTILDIDSGSASESAEEAGAIRITGQRNGVYEGLIIRHQDESGGNTDVDEGCAIVFQGYDGSNSFHDLAAIYARSNETSVSDNDSPGFLSFHVTPDGSQTLNEAMRIAKDGKVGIGRSPLVTFHIEDDPNDVVMFADNDQSSGNVYIAKYKFSGRDPNDTTSYFLSCEDSANRLRIYSNGDVYTTTGTDIQALSSDERMKTSIQDYTGGLAIVNSLKPRTYEWKPGRGEAGIKYGFISQEIQAISDVKPEMNLYSKRTIEADDKDIDLCPDGIINTTQLSAKDTILISAIQELSAKVDTMQTEINNLKG